MAGVLAAASLVVQAPAAIAAGDAARGGPIFTSRCAICHSILRGGPNKLGPNLFGVVGRRAATVPGFPYSAAMKNSGVTWTEAAIRSYVQQPAKFVPGNKMAFAGIPNAALIDDLIAYLSQQR